MRDLVIIGGGAAGLSAALYALGKGIDTVTIYEDVGGKAGTQTPLRTWAYSRPAMSPRRLPSRC